MENPSTRKYVDTDHKKDFKMRLSGVFSLVSNSDNSKLMWTLKNE